MSENSPVLHMKMENFMSYVPEVTQVTLRHRASESVQQQLLELLNEIAIAMPKMRAQYVIRRSKIGGYFIIEASGHAPLINLLTKRATEMGWKPVSTVQVLNKIRVREFEKGEPMGQEPNMWVPHSQRALERQEEKQRAPRYIFQRAENAVAARKALGIPYDDIAAIRAALEDLQTMNVSDEVIAENVETQSGRAKHREAIYSRKVRAIKKRGGGLRSRKTRRQK